jgi:hypothetical protein
MTTRRHLLGILPALGAVTLAGCLTTYTSGEESGAGPVGGNGDGQDGGDANSGGDGDVPDSNLPGGDAGDASGQTRLRGTGGPGVSLAFSDAQPSLPLEVAVDVTREAATDEHPPGLRVSITNTSDRAIGVGEGRDVVFAYRPSTDGLLTLLPAEMEAPTEPGCWRLTDAIATTREYRITRIEAGETVEQDLSLYASYDEAEADTCLPVGEHRFESRYAVTDEDGEARREATWGFSVLLE